MRIWTEKVTLTWYIRSKLQLIKDEHLLTELWMSLLFIFSVSSVTNCCWDYFVSCQWKINTTKCWLLFYTLCNFKSMKVLPLRLLGDITHIMVNVYLHLESRNQSRSTTNKLYNAPLIFYTIWKTAQSFRAHCAKTQRNKFL